MSYLWLRILIKLWNDYSNNKSQHSFGRAIIRTQNVTSKVQWEYKSWVIFWIFGKNSQLKKIELKDIKIWVSFYLLRSKSLIEIYNVERYGNVLVISLALGYIKNINVIYFLKGKLLVLYINKMQNTNASRIKMNSYWKIEI